MTPSSGRPAHWVALDCLAAGIDTAHPERVVREALSLSEGELRITDVCGETIAYDIDVFERVGGGNAAAHLGSTLADLLGDRLRGGVVVTDDPADVGPIKVQSGDHLYPSERGTESTGAEDLLIALITGGSALFVAPAGFFSVADLLGVTKAVLASGAATDEINAVLRRCSEIKGGGSRRPRHPLASSGL